jgi:F-type H+-transporting ATPase subunit b
VISLRRALAGGAIAFLGFPALALAQAEAEAAEKFAGLPVDVWKTVNLLLILGLLVWFLGRPFNNYFRRRREDLDERIERARQEREEAVRLVADMQARLDRLGAEIAEIRRHGAEEGETEKAAHIAAAEREAEQLRRNAVEEIDRRLAAAKAELKRAAADLAVERARKTLAGEMTEEDRRRYLDESLRKVSQG